MTWDFQLRASNQLFNYVTVDVEPGDSHNFETDGRRHYIDEANNIVRRDNCMMITHGSLTIDVENQDPVEYVFDDFTWDEETGMMGNTNPFPYDRQVYPGGDWMVLTGGQQGTTWNCFMPHEGRKLSYEAFKGSHGYRFHEEDMDNRLNLPGYVVILAGHGCIGGIGDCELRTIYEFAPRAEIYVEGDDDTIVFYVWERS